MAGVPGRSFDNVGADKEWKGFQSKVELYKQAVDDVASTDPERILILADGGDMAFGGCETSEIQKRYQAIVDASGGAPVVCGADLHVWPVHTDWHPKGPAITGADRYDGFDHRMRDVLSAFEMDEKSYSDFDSQITPRWVNSGFLMGPANTLGEVLQCMGEQGWDDGEFDDQLGLAYCMFDNPYKITIDYSGSLVMTMMGFDRSVIEGRDGLLYNHVTQKPQCFIHFNAFAPPVKWDWINKWVAAAGMDLAATTATPPAPPADDAPGKAAGAAADAPPMTSSAAPAATTPLPASTTTTGTTTTWPSTTITSTTATTIATSTSTTLPSTTTTTMMTTMTITTTTPQETSSASATTTTNTTGPKPATTTNTTTSTTTSTTSTTTSTTSASPTATTTTTSVTTTSTTATTTKLAEPTTTTRTTTTTIAETTDVLPSTTKEAAAAAAATAPDDAAAAEDGSDGAGTSYDCHDRFSTWKTDWVLAKAIWCCKHELLGCLEGWTASA